MFFCDNCRYENGWPEGWIKSQGRCEVCKRPALCSDIPSRFLFPPEPEGLYYWDDVVPRRTHTITGHYTIKEVPA